MKRRIVSALLMICIAIIFISTGAFADNSAVSGTCGESLNWTLDGNGTLTISGTGKMSDFSYSGSTMPPWSNYSSSIKSVVINSGVTRIGSYAFYCYDLVSLSLPDTVTSIGGYAIIHTQKLKQIDVSKDNPSFSSIDGVLFNKSATELIDFPSGRSGSYAIPDGTTTISYGAFSDCNGLTSIIIPVSVKTILGGAFNYCSGLKDVYYRGSQDQWALVYVDQYNENFKNASKHFGRFTITYDVNGGIGEIEAQTKYDEEDLKITSTVPTRDGYDFLGWAKNKDAAAADYQSDDVYSGDSDVTLYAVWEKSIIDSGTCGDSLTWAFDGGTLTISGIGAMTDYKTSDFTPWNEYRTEILAVVIDSGVSHIGDCAFSNFSSLLICAIPYGVESIGNYTFELCNFANIDLPNSLEVIGDYAFSGCGTGFTEWDFEIPDSVTAIGERAFFGCSNLTEISIPKNVKNIGDGIFSCCTNLTAINVDNENSEFCSIDGVLFDKFGTKILSVPEKRSGKYTIPDSVTSIGNFAFEYCSALTEISIPDNVKSIGNYAFFCCRGLKNIEIPSKVESIGNFGFYGCDNLTSIIISDSVTNIGSDAFRECSKLSTVYYGGSMSDWSKIAVGSNNDPITNATFVYNYGASQLKDFSVLLPPAMSANVSITAPSGGWVIGDNTFSASADKACVLAVSYDGGQTYTKLSATANGDGTYNFDVNIADENTVIACAYKGDVNGDNELTSGDINSIKAAMLNKSDLSALESLAADVNGDNDITSADINRLKAAMLKKATISW